tara:strand:+ start:1921 stop:2388 length:468 start_codon:yes stop_codon:yes gene_type:complete
MTDENLKKAILIIQRLLNNNKIKWAIIGSTNMRLQGINVHPNDLDIVIQLKDLKKINKIFSEYNASAIKKLKPLGNEPSWEIKLKIGDIEVQILGEKSTGQYVSKLLANKLIKIEFGDLKIPCFTLETEAQTYEETNRKHKSNLIQDFLKREKYH